MTPNEVFDEFRSSFQARKFTAGLLLAFIDFLAELAVPALGLMSFEDFLAHFERQTKTAAGKRANTLIVDRGAGQTLSIRPFYNKAERYFRAEQKRFLITQQFQPELGAGRAGAGCAPQRRRDGVPDRPTRSAD